MRWCRFRSGDDVAFAYIDGDRLHEITGTPFGAFRETGRKIPLSEADLDVPVYPGNFYAIGSNYASHIETRSKVKGTKPIYYDAPRVGHRANSALLPHGHAIMKPKGSTDDFQYEAELVAVIGKRMRRVTPDEARAGIFGWTIGNDVTERNWQKSDPTNLRSKNGDTFKPMGPWIETDVDLPAMRTLVFLNGQKLHDFATNNMLFRPEQVISAISQSNTLHPGDVIWLGTDELPVNLKPGDQLDITITGIGTLSNPVIDDSGV
jgi:2-keto-4-pentenoate hydratase/2-oxohepta-3-ene-1,7-dioic acid hydratase in catechol pathway